MTTVGTAGVSWPGNKPPLEVIFRGSGSKRIRRTIANFFRSRPTAFNVRVKFSKSGSYDTERFNGFLIGNLIPSLRGERVSHVEDPDESSDESASDVSASSSEDEGEKAAAEGAGGQIDGKKAALASALADAKARKVQPTAGGGSSNQQQTAAAARGAKLQATAVSADFFAGHRPSAALKAGLMFGWIGALRTDKFQVNDTHVHGPLSRLYQEKEIALQSARAHLRNDYSRTIISRVDALRILLECWEELPHAKFSTGFESNGFFPDAAPERVGSGLRKMFAEAAITREQPLTYFN
jgi:hypothetical protein